MTNKEIISYLDKNNSRTDHQNRPTRLQSIAEQDLTPQSVNYWKLFITWIHNFRAHLDSRRGTPLDCGTLAEISHPFILRDRWVKVKVTLRLTASQSVSWCQTPSGAHDQILDSVWLLMSLSLWGALSDERTGLSFVRVIVSSNMSIVRMYNILTFHMLYNIYKAYVSPGSVQQIMPYLQ
jgi:hypothetical protein